MPIVVKHGPSMQLLGLNGLLAGHADFQKWQVEQQQKEAQLAEQARRTSAGIFADQQRLGQRAYEFEAARFSERDMLNRQSQQRGWRDQWLAQQEQQRDAQRAGQQQALQQQRAMSQAELLEQRAQGEYDQSVAEALQDFDWEPTQERELAKFDQGRIKIENNPHWDDAQKADAMQQLMQHKRRTIGLPKKRKEKTVTFRNAVDANGQPIFDAGGNPVRVFDNGTRGEIYQDPTLEEQSKIRFQQEKAELDRQTKEIDARGKAMQTQMDIVAKAGQALITDVVDAKGTVTGKKLPDAQQLIQYLQTVQAVGQAVGMSIQNTQQQGPIIGDPAAQAAPQQPQGWQGVNNPQRRDFPGDVSEPQPQQAPSRQYFSPRLKRQVTEQEVMETAQKHGISPEEVLKRLGV